MTIQLTEKELTWCEGQAQKRHDKKNMRFRNTGILMENVNSSKHKFYLPHLTGIVGEKAYGKLIGAEVDTRLYDVRDDGEDFKGVEVKSRIRIKNPRTLCISESKNRWLVQS